MIDGLSSDCGVSISRSYLSLVLMEVWGLGFVVLDGLRRRNSDEHMCDIIVCNLRRRGGIGKKIGSSHQVQVSSGWRHNLIHVEKERQTFDDIKIPT